MVPTANSQYSYYTSPCSPPLPYPVNHQCCSQISCSPFKIPPHLLIYSQSSALDSSHSVRSPCSGGLGGLGQTVYCRRISRVSHSLPTSYSFSSPSELLHVLPDPRVTSTLTQTRYVAIIVECLFIRQPQRIPVAAYNTTQLS